MLKIYLILLSLLLVRVTLFYSTASQFEPGSEIVVSGRLTEEPRVSKGDYVLVVQGVRTYVPVKNVYHYGDYVVISGTFNGRYIEDPVVEVVAKGVPHYSIFDKITTRVEEIYFSVLPSSQAQILSGMVLGSEIANPELKNDMASAGLIHMVVVSGMNLTLLGGFLTALFTGLKVHKRWVVVIVSAAVIFYALLTGFQPPVVRALIMFEAVLLGGIVGRKSGGLFALMAAAYLMLWADPSLITNFSFLLSFASMMGLIFVSIVKVSLPALLKAVVLVVLQNIFAILFTAPIILIGFGRFSPISIISNLLVVWTVEPLMMVGGVAGIVGLFGLAGLSRLLLTPLSFLLEYFLLVTKMFGEGEKFVWHIEGFNVFIAIGYYLVLFASIYYLQARGDRMATNGKEER